MGERKNLAVLEWLEGSCTGTRNMVNKRHITPRQFEVGDAVVAKIGSKSYKGKVIELPQSMEENRGVKRARKEAKGDKAKAGKGAKKAKTSKGTKKAKATRKTKPKRDISGFQVSVYSIYCALPGGMNFSTVV